MDVQWLRVAHTGEVPDGGTLQVECAGRTLCLYRIEGRIYATDDHCTHGDASLADGTIYGEDIECPYHAGMFHIPTGRAVGFPCEQDIAVHGVRVEGDEVYVTAEPAPAAEHPGA